MFAKLLGNELDETIPDVGGTGFADSKKDWYTNFVSYIAKKGIMNGYPDGEFKPDRPITRAEIATLIANF